nr:phosphoribosylamine--glycine ligase [Helcobacillus sp. ACRRO]
MAPVKILVVGHGGREHAIVRRLSLDSPAPEIHAAPGNPGIAELATVHDIAVTDHQGIIALARDLAIDLVVIGPEAPLVNGLADDLTAAGITVFGPSQAAAQLEGSKDFAKSVMHRAGVPTSRSVTVTKLQDVEAALDAMNPSGRVPYVVKDDGLAAGKGVVVSIFKEDALDHAEAALSAPGGRVVIEEFLDGPELSVFCISDGTTVRALAPAQDFKRAFNFDQGPNTGGMGAYSPLPWIETESVLEEVVRTVAQPTVDAMREDGTPFVGILYCGLSRTKQGLRVIEFNARFGDPETQVVLERLASPFAPLLLAAAKGELDQAEPLRWHDHAAVTVVLASEGYPKSARKGDVIGGIEKAEEFGAHIIHAGTALNPRGELVSDGGRVLSVVAVGESLEDARSRAQMAISHITLPGSHFRTDIAQRAAAGEVEA